MNQYCQYKDFVWEIKSNKNNYNIHIFIKPLKKEIDNGL